MSGRRVYFGTQLQLKPCLRVYFWAKKFIPPDELNQEVNKIIQMKPPFKTKLHEEVRKVYTVCFMVFSIQCFNGPFNIDVYHLKTTHLSAASFMIEFVVCISLRIGGFHF